MTILTEVPEATTPWPPVAEPPGFRCAAGYMKSQPENNDYYISLFLEDEWYPALKFAHDSLEDVAPGYNISLIKEKFGGLRFYFTLPEGSTDTQHRKAGQIVQSAEDWVWGWEAHKRHLEGNDDSLPV